MSMTLDTARRILDAALAKSAELKLKPLAVAVLDAGGCMIAFAAQDGSSLLRGDVARGKAYGALALGMGSRAIFKRAQEQAFFIDAVNTLAQGAIVPVPGGVLIRYAGRTLLGAIGISGDTSDNDELCASAGTNAKEREKQAAALASVSAALATLKAEKPANGDATAIGRYLALLGIDVAADRVADALNALTVAAVEIVAGLALMLGRVPESIPSAASGDSGPKQQAPKPLIPNVESVGSNGIRKALAAGPLTGRQRDLAAMFNLPVSTFRRKVESIPGVRLTATATGSRLELVA